MKALVVFHGDCDGVISAGLFIRRFLMDYYPKNLVLRFTQPWRIVRDLESALKSAGIDKVEEIVILDLALNDELLEFISANLRNKRITIVDHHASSSSIVRKFAELPNVKVVWEHTISTPAVLVRIIKNLNPYEETLINVANTCEGGEACNDTVRQAADRIKVALALDPTDSSTFYQTALKIVEGIEIWTDKEIESRYRRGKWLLNMLVRNLERRSVNICGWYVSSFTAPESLVYAGMFGIASSEFSKKHHKPVVLVRGEEGKIVITIRSPDGKALDLCRAIAEAMGASFYGGHREAASLTLYTSESLDKVVAKLKEVVKRFARC
ncbi:MAG: hypothetical protein GXO32_08965 [Crenarchaeota archaeon]|nr:hypothetical protein [Thermoproteota archaeon]